MKSRDSFLEVLKEDKGFQQSVLRSLLAECELNVSISVNDGFGWDGEDDRLEVEVSLEKVTYGRWGNEREKLLSGSDSILLGNKNSRKNKELHDEW